MWLLALSLSLSFLSLSSNLHISAVHALCVHINWEYEWLTFIPGCENSA